MFQSPITTEELLDAWRDAARAAELAERLADAALKAAGKADRNVETARQIAGVAEEAAASAERAAEAARAALRLANELAAEARDVDLLDADNAASAARAAEGKARDRYHDAERDARARQGLIAQTPTDGTTEALSGG